jgi:hypothetical protein
MDLAPPLIGLALAFAARAVGDGVGGRDIVTTALSSCLYSAAYAAVMALFFVPRGLRERLETNARGAA